MKRIMLTGLLALFAGTTYGMELALPAVEGAKTEVAGPAYDLNDSDIRIENLYTCTIHPSYDDQIAENPETELVRVMISCLLEAYAKFFNGMNENKADIYNLPESYYVFKKLASEMKKWLEDVKKRVDTSLLVDISYVYKRKPLLNQGRYLYTVKDKVLRNKKEVSLDKIFRACEYQFNKTTRYASIKLVKLLIEEHNKNYASQELAIQAVPQQNVVAEVEDDMLWIGVKKSWVQGLFGWAGFKPEPNRNVSQSPASLEAAEDKSLLLRLGSMFGASEDEDSVVGGTLLIEGPGESASSQSTTSGTSGPIIELID